MNPAARTITRQQVLSLYKRILQLSRTWQATLPSNTVTEREYIREEARKLFNKNKELTDVTEIKLCIEEANARLELAIHYNNPYPRQVNVPHNFVPASKNKKAQLKRTKQSVPIYIRSQDK